MSKTPFENACWIWDDGDPKPVNAYRVFRKIVRGPDTGQPHKWMDGRPVETLEGFISAQTSYQLFLNERLIASGPAPSARGYIAYDPVQLRLHAGENTIGVIVHSIGIPILSQIDNPAGFILDLGEIVSDETWEVATLSPWRDAPRWSPFLGFAEVQDAQVDLRPWAGSLREPAEWKRATCIAPKGESPFGALIPRGANSCNTALDGSEEERWKSHWILLAYGNCESEDGSDIAARLESETLLPLTSGQIDISEDGAVEVEPGDKDIWLLFDMGEEVSGSVLLSVRTGSGNIGARIDIGYSEVFDPNASPSGLMHGGSGKAFSYADRFILHDGLCSFASFAPRTLRYLRLALGGLKAPIAIERLALRDTTYPVRNRGAFISSDARLDNIWEVGRRTLQLCMAETFMDCPSRERAQYIADARIEAIGAQYCFGDTLLHRRFLQQTALGQHPDGSIDPCGPGEWNTITPNAPIPGFMAIYIQSALDYYMHTGDGELIAVIMPAIQKALGWLASYGGAEGGLLTQVAGWNFTDWADGLSNWNPGFKTREPGVSAPVNLFYLQALRAAAYLADLAGDEAAAVSSRTRATMVAGAFDSLFWSVKRGVYVDGVVAGEQSENASQQVNALALLCGLGSEVRKELILESLFEDEGLTQIGSPYFSYYLVQALARCGQHREALSYIREKWGAMRDAGATTWWERWDGDGSRCHGWSIAPTIWLTEHVLGVTPHEPGFACVNIAPKPCDLLWARGIVPIPQGNVLVSWKRDTGQMTIDVSAPAGVHIRPVLPCAPTDLLIVDGEPVAPDSITLRTSACAELAVLPGSGYRFEVVQLA